MLPNWLLANVGGRMGLCVSREVETFLVEHSGAFEEVRDVVDRRALIGMEPRLMRRGRWQEGLW